MKNLTLRLVRRCLRLVTFVVAAVYCSCALAEPLADTTTPPSRLQKSEHVQVFDEAIHILGGNVNVISKWIQPIRLVVVGDIAISSDANDANDATEQPDSAADFARAVIAEVATLTGLTVAVASDSYVDADAYLHALNRSARFTLSDCVYAAEVKAVCGNFYVVFAEIAEMEAIAKAIPMRPVYQKAFANPDAIRCFFSPFQTGYMEIRQALVFVRKDLSPEMVRTCVQEEIYQSFGMFNDYTGSSYYSFNNKIEPKVITRYDRALLETIYDPGFRQGAPVFMVVKKLMERLGLDPFSNE